jgi:hypothetical protein
VKGMLGYGLFLRPFDKEINVVILRSPSCLAPLLSQFVLYRRT